VSASAQDFINPYANYHNYFNFETNSIYPDYENITSSAYYHWTSMKTDFPGNVGQGYYWGEFEISLQDFFWAKEYPNFGNSFKASYTYETVSFPFTLDCAFNLGCAGSFTGNYNTRHLQLPDNSQFYIDISTNSEYWLYNPPTTPQYDKLYRLTPLQGFGSTPHFYSDQTSVNSLVSACFKGGPIMRRAIPHSVIKVTLNLHCGINIFNDPIISKVSFLYDNTRGQMRFYPFIGTNDNGNMDTYDVIFRPEIITDDLSPHTYNQFQNENVFEGNDGGTINYFPYDETIAAIGACNLNIPYLSVPQGNDVFCCAPNYEFAYPAPYTLVSSPLRSYTSSCLAGYKIYQGNYVARDGIPHKYYIDKNINLENINPSEMTIYNPSEADVTATDLHFPEGYTFKTIRGQYATLNQVNTDNTAANGGPYPTTDLRPVPVTTDLYYEGIDNYPTNDHRYASVYKLQSGSKLTVEGCVYIFDAAFDCKPGSEMIFENINTFKNAARCTLLYNGGTVTKRAHDFYFQNYNETESILKFESDGVIEAGYNVTSSVPVGNYVVATNANVTFTSADEVTLKDGFTAQAGSEFLASIANVTVPDCVHPPHGLRLDNSANTRTNNNSDELNLILFPNPTSGNFDIQVMNGNRNSLRKVYLTDMFGRQIMYEEKVKRSRFEIDLTNQPKGIYFVKIVEGDRIGVKKIILM
jgi:hypothetical protein